MSKGYSVELHFDQALENQVLKAWNVLARRQISTQLIEIESRPHIKLYTTPFIVPERIEPTLRSFVSSQNPLPISLSTIGSFPSEKNVIFLAPTPSIALLRFHSLLGDALRTDGVVLDEECVGDSWIPYCPVAQDVKGGRIGDAFAVLREMKLPVSGYAMDISLTEYSPVREVFCFELNGNEDG